MTEIADKFSWHQELTDIRDIATGIGRRNPEGMSEERIDYDGKGLSVLAEVEDDVLSLYVEYDGREIELEQPLRRL